MCPTRPTFCGCLERRVAFILFHIIITQTLRHPSSLLSFACCRRPSVALKSGPYTNMPNKEQSISAGFSLQKNGFVPIMQQRWHIIRRTYVMHNNTHIVKQKTLCSIIHLKNRIDKTGERGGGKSGMEWIQSKAQ